MTVEAPEITLADIAAFEDLYGCLETHLSDFDRDQIKRHLAWHRIASHNAMTDHAGKLVVAYHMAICSPKGVVPNDEFYDPAMAAELERRLGDAIRAGSTGDKG